MSDATEAVMQRISEAQSACRDLAKRFIRHGSSHWIPISLSEGWSSNLEELSRSAAYKFWVKNQRFPTFSEMDQASISGDDHKYFKNHGRPHTDCDLKQIREARKGRSDSGEIKFRN